MLRVGIIGCGDISNLNVLGYIHSQDAELVAVADTDVKCAADKLERWGLRSLKIYDDYKKMVDREDLDIVEILTPHYLHAPMAEYAAKAGVPGISVQKPLAHAIADCESMIEACKEAKVKLKLFENFRFYPPYLRAKELLDQGIIGELLNFRINTILTAGPSMPVGLRAHLWRIDLDKCGGGPLVYDDGIHKFSMALWLMGQERVEKVYAWIDYFTGVMDAPANIFWKYPSKNPTILQNMVRWNFRWPQTCITPQIIMIATNSWKFLVQKVLCGLTNAPLEVISCQKRSNIRRLSCMSMAKSKLTVKIYQEIGDILS